MTKAGRMSNLTRLILSIGLLWAAPCSGHVPSIPQLMEVIQGQMVTRDEAAEHASHMYSELGNLNLHSFITDPRNLWNLTDTFRELSSGSEPSACGSDTLTLLIGLLEGKPWALNMLDSYGKLPSGIILGNVMAWFGEFSQCRSTEVPIVRNNVTETLYRGQYCVAYVGNDSIPITPATAPSMLKIGICFPDSCSSLETTYILASWLAKLQGGNPAYNVKYADCKVREKPPLPAGAIAVIVILSILGAVILCGTCYDVFVFRPRVAAMMKMTQSHLDDRSHDDTPEISVADSSPLVSHDMVPPVVSSQPYQSFLSELLLCFSLVTNGSKILSVQTDRGQTLGAVHGIRFLSMSWVILGHTIVFVFLGGGIKNSAVILEFVSRFSFQAIINATVSVDSFFLLSGTLAAYLILNQIQKAGGVSKVNWGLVYFHRFWRLTPPYMLILAIYTTLFHYMGAGPFFPTAPDANCSKNWWQNLLYINNFFPSTGSCIGWVWYLANDMQFFIISPLILILLYKWVIAGVVVLSGLILTNIITVWVLDQVNDYAADFGAADIRHMAFANPGSFDNVYVRPYCRVGAYAVGLALGYILHRTQSRPKLPKVAALCGWLVAAGCCMGVLYGLYGIADGSRTMSHDVNAFYGAVHRIVWALGVAWVIFACCTGFGGPINTFLSWSAFVPLSRLTYMAYLVHPIIMSYVYMTQDQTIYLCDMTIAYLFIGHMVMTYGAAFVLSVTLESPMMALEKLILPRKHR